MTNDISQFNQGMMSGHITATQTTKTSPKFWNKEVPEEERPEQPRISATLSQLKAKSKYLCVRVFKLGGLPSADPETGTANPVVRVRYSGQVQHSVPLYNTTAPVINNPFS